MICIIRMHPRLSSSRTKAGNRFLLHLATNGNLHCVAAEVHDDDGSVQIIDGVSKWTISSKDFRKRINCRNHSLNRVVTRRSSVRQTRAMSSVPRGIRAWARLHLDGTRMQRSVKQSAHMGAV